MTGGELNASSRRSNVVWYAVIGVLVVVLAGAVAWVSWPKDGEGTATPSPSRSAQEPSSPTVSEEPTPSPSLSGSPSTSPQPPGWSGDPEADPDLFGGYPPPKVFEPLFQGKIGNIELPAQLAGFERDDSAYDIGPGSSLAYYSKGDVNFSLKIDPMFGSYETTMEGVENHRIVGISVCGDVRPGVVSCATATEDADITLVSPVPDGMDDVAINKVLEEVIAHYRSQ